MRSSRGAFLPISPASVIFGLAAVRHIFVLRAIMRARAFQDTAPKPHDETHGVADGDQLASGQHDTAQHDIGQPSHVESRFYIVVPVLREAAVLPATVHYLTTLGDGHEAELVIVTTERENAERDHHPDAPDTITLARQLARTAARCRWMHYPDPNGVKADQLNHVVAELCSGLNEEQASRSFLLCYDADSRPAANSLDVFASAIAQCPGTDVFHQSSRFTLPERPARPRDPTGPRRVGQVGRALDRLVADAGALRADRFVFAYELPRLLNRSRGLRPSPTSVLTRRDRWRSAAASFVYTHVTGHGLCIRLTRLRDLPFPPGSPLEDMHYSFILNSQRLPMQPVPSLDVAEVPDTLSVQVRQAARWFYGPGRFRRYLRDPQTAPGPRRWILTGSAALICLEWLSCAVTPTALAVVLRPGSRASRSTRGAAAVFASLYGAQLLVVDRVCTPNSPRWRRVARLVAYPIACTAFGAGGISGAAQLLRGASGRGKTER